MIYLVSHYPPDKGGAEMFLQEVQQWLEEEGHDTKWAISITSIKNDATLIITSGVDQTVTAQWASNKQIPCIVLFQHWKELYDPIKRVINDLFFDLSV